MDSVQKTSSADPGCIRPTYFGSFDHFRYDALGRRVLTRSYGTQTTSNSIERYVWDGSDLLWEIHYPGAAGTADSVLELDTLAMMQKLSCEEVHPHDCGWDYGDTLFMQLPDSTPYVGGIGRIVYTHGAQMDQPMSMIRFGYASDSVLIPPFAVMPHHDYRGLPDIGTYSSGNTSYTYFGLLVNIDYFAPQSTLHMQRMTSSIPHGWFGGLLSQQQTPAVDMYMRNRYYDPMQGRFTQEDPIGLAGGMNLYGFAAGDPVNFSDPFGLTCLVAGNCTQSDVSVRDTRAARVGLGLIVSPQIPKTFARVIPNVKSTTLGRPGDADTFVTDATKVRGMSATELQQALGIEPSETGYKVIEFPSARTPDAAVPINRTNPGFVGRGFTSPGGLPEWVVPNGPIPEGSTVTEVPLDPIVEVPIIP